MLKRGFVYGMVLLVVLLLVGTVGSLSLQQGGENPSRGAIFLTIGLNQTALPNESSSYEIHRASEHFANLLLGWTIEPSFNEDFLRHLPESTYTGTYSGRLQEKQNLLFLFSVYDAAAMTSFVDTLQERINEYNGATGAAYVIAIQRHSMLAPLETNYQVLAGLLLLTTLFMVLCFMSWEYALSARRRS